MQLLIKGCRFLLLQKLSNSKNVGGMGIMQFTVTMLLNCDGIICINEDLSINYNGAKERNLISNFYIKSQCICRVFLNILETLIRLCKCQIKTVSNDI